MHQVHVPKADSNTFVIPAPKARGQRVKGKQVFKDRRLKRQGTRATRRQAAMVD